ncbi:3'-5' exonuclease [Lacticigenium naphthae]|uniref:3'-5' exonuclease n=1 Tax=Lacticigenium naphthae TaxID=515351 RepID=UPI00042A82E3|nr:3'-5' exonuclease [Lacticigenium naphthae]
MDFVAIDFETANRERHSACSLALTIVKNSEIVGEYYSLIKPPTFFDRQNIRIHGIQEEDVQFSPIFPEVWQDIREYFTPNQLIVAHNLPFDRGVLNKTLAYYDIETPHFQTLCSVQASRKLLKELPNHKLNTVSSHLNIPLKRHHHALDDSLASAGIILRLEEQYGTTPFRPLIKFY